MYLSPKNVDIRILNILGRQKDFPDSDEISGHCKGYSVRMDEQSSKIFVTDCPD